MNWKDKIIKWLGWLVAIATWLIELLTDVI